MNASRQVRARIAALIVAGLALQACSDGQPSAPLSAVLEADGLAASATVHTEVRPTVVLRDERGRARAGERVTFEVTEGGGSVSGSAATTDAEGRATVGWTLGRAAGTNALVARAGAGGTTTFTVMGTPAAAAAMSAAMEVPPVAAVSTPITAPPAVRVTDAYGNGVAGIAVTFAAESGGGSVSGGSQITDQAGLATAGAWLMGAVEGEHTLHATAAGLPAVVFTTRALAVSGEWAQLASFAGDDTTCPVGSSGCSFTVQVTNAQGGAVAGEAILWRGANGEIRTTVTNVHGRATAPNLSTHAQPGTFQQTAQLLGAGDEVAFRYRTVASGGFRIDLRYVVEPSAAVRAAFENARARWEQVITGNLPAVSLTGTGQVAANACGITHPAVNETVDDLLIFVEVVPIDGPGKILGSAGPCRIRSASGLPVLGVIKLDADDLDLMATRGILTDVVLHEVGHVLGLGTLWSRFSLVDGAGTSDPLYTGRRAQSGFVLGGGSALGGVPLENTGGAGTREGHWRESVLDNELMTGWVNTGSNPLSVITIGSLLDMGYEVNFGAADSYGLTGAFKPQGPHLHTDRIELHQVPLPLPAPERVR
jgi:hypothetical protein